MRSKKKMTAIGLACLLTVSAPFGSMAQEKPESMDQETWERLQDNVLEYDEIGNLVEYYNPTYQQALQNVQINIQPYEDAAEQLRGTAKELIDDAKNEKDDNVMLYMTYRGYAKGYQEAAKTFEKVAQKIKSSTRSTLNSARKQLTSGVQQLILGYYQALASKELVDTAAELSQAAYDSTLTQRNLGMATDGDVQSALKSLQSAQAQQQSLNDTLTSLKRNLQFMTGWSYDAQVDIGEAPVPDLSRIDGMNPENDLPTAIGNNYTLLGQRRASANSTADRDAKMRTLDESEAKIKVQLDTLYQEVAQSKAAYEASLLALESANLTMAGNEKKYEMGMLGRLEYLQLKLAYLQQKMAADAASLNLVQAIENYNWAVEGLADIS
ncbi:MAG: TolC family protein [Hungatella sp.]|jgi:outer membrane protein TolC|nr:TolC family protein [Hungatella sp.]